jgi:hypothetical protein
MDEAVWPWLCADLCNTCADLLVLGIAYMQRACSTCVHACAVMHLCLCPAALLLWLATRLPVPCCRSGRGSATLWPASSRRPVAQEWEST